MNSLYNIANATIQSADLSRKITFPDGKTDDIITEILETSKISLDDTAKFAHALKGKNIDETLSNIWHFLKRNISYRLDPMGFQFVKTPSRTWHDKFADCKSFSIFVASLLKNLGIPFSYRFVSFIKGGEFTHVYVVVPLQERTIIMDVVMPAYNSEKPFARKKDFYMTQISRLSGIGEQPLQTKIIDLGPKDIGSISEGEMDLLLARDRLRTEQAIMAGKRGIGSIYVEKYQDGIDMINDSIAAVNDYLLGNVEDIDVELALISKQASGGEYSNANAIYGIGDIGERRKMRTNKRKQLKNKRTAITRRLKPEQKANIWEDPEISGIGKTKGFLKKVASKVKKAAKAVVKVNKAILKKTIKVTKAVTKASVKLATLPQRMIAKGILEVTLPKAAPFFLYLFITDPKVLEKCPAKVKAKRKKAEKISNFIVNGIGMKRPHFMAIIRNGIMKHYKKSPEVVLGEMLKGKISGIGVIAATVITALISIISKIAKLIKKKGEKVSASDSPDGSDFSEISTAIKETIANEVKLQPENTSALNTDSENPDQPLSAEMKAVQQSKTANESDSGDITTTASGDTSGEFESGGKRSWNSLSF